MSSALASLSGSFRELAEEAKYQQRRADLEADRQRIKAEERAEAQADAAEFAAAAKGFTNTKREIDEAIRRGEISSYDQLSERADALLTAASATQNPSTNKYLTGKTLDMLDTFGTRLLDINEEKRKDGLAASASNVLMSLVDSNSSLTDDEFMDSLDAGLDSFIESGHSKEDYYKTAVSILSNAALQKADTQEGEDLYDRLERLRTANRLTPQSPEALLAYHNFQNEYARRSREHSNAEERRSIDEDTKRRTTVFNNLNSETLRQTDIQKVTQSRIYFESHEGFQNLKDAMGDELAQQTLMNARERESFLQRAGKPDMEEENRTAAYAIAEWQSCIDQNNEMVTRSQLADDPRLRPWEVNELAKRVDIIKSKAAETVWKDVSKTYIDLIKEAQTSTSWVGAIKQTERGFEVDPRFEAYAKARISEAGTKAFLSINPQSAEEEAERSLAVQEALKAIKSDLLKNAPLYNLSSDVRPAVTGENAIIDFEKYPLQEEDIRRGLFSERTGIARTARGDVGGKSVDFNRKFYEALPLDIRRGVAADMLIKRGAEEYLERKVAAERSPVSTAISSWFWPTVDPAVQERDLFEGTVYDLDLTQQISTE